MDTDATVKNKWHWNRLELETEYKRETFLNSFEKKIRIPGKVYCSLPPQDTLCF